MKRQTRLRLGGLVAALMAALLAAAFLWGSAAAGAGDPSPTPQTVAAAVTPTIDCSHSPMGQKVKMVAEDEIAITVRSNTNKALEYAKLDNSGQNLIWGGNWFGTGDVSDIRWPAIAAGDLNGDGRKEAVMAFRDKQKRLAVMTVNGSEWYLDSSAFKGGNVSWIDVATGNLDRSTNGDDEVVLALENDSKDMSVILLDGNSAGRISQASNQMLIGYWGDSKDGRGDVKYVSVATGDLNGDGYDDEIVAAFKDGGGYLQVWIMRKETDLVLLKAVRWKPADGSAVANEGDFSPNTRPIDVTTGDIDGDKRDEVIVAFRSGPADVDGFVRLLVLDRKLGTTEAYDTWVAMERKLEEKIDDAAVAASVSAADLDGDGKDEVALVYTEVNYSQTGALVARPVLATYRYVPQSSVEWDGCYDDATAPQPHPCLQERPGYWSTSWLISSADNLAKARAMIATGDLDADGKAEIALMFQESSSGDGRVLSFDADTDTSLYQPRSQYAITWSGGDRVEEFWLDMGDLDGNSRYATYTGACHEETEAQVTTVLHAPPYWPGENQGSAEAGFGQRVTTGAGTGVTNESRLGGSVKTSFELGMVTASYTRGWEKSAAVGNTRTTQTVEGTSFSTDPGGSPPYSDAIELIKTRQWCYDYVEVGAPAHKMAVCIPQPEPMIIAYPLEWWYITGTTTYASSWVPVGVNLAEGRAATQSSNSVAGPTAGYAVDGNTDGDLNHLSVTQTGYDQYAWWQVDLGSVQWIGGLQVWNRTDCCQDRLSNWYVFVSDMPFPTTDPTKMVAMGMWNRHYSDYPAPMQNVPVARSGRYVRIQLAGTNYLNLAEVQVWGRPGTPAAWPTTRPVTGTNTIRLSWPGDRVQTVSGQLVYARSSTALGVGEGSAGTGFDMGMETGQEQVTEGSSSENQAVGLEIKYGVEGPIGASWTFGGEVAWGSTKTTSYSVSWSQGMEFSGRVAGQGLTSGHAYSYMPYIWLQKATSSGGVRQAFLVLDYWVPCVGFCGLMLPPPIKPGLPVTPTVPLINSFTHPDADTWYASSTAAFTWTQPTDDPAALAGYSWYMDQAPDTVPDAVNLGLTTAYTYTDLTGGLWYLHVRAVGPGDLWGNTAHRAIRVDADAPLVSLAVDPSLPTGNNGWYRTPLTVTMTANDGTGSGVAALEVSTDGATWQPYSAALPFTADTASTTVWARATDGVGRTSTPVSTTFKIDMTPPSSHVSGGQGPGAWVATVITNSVGNPQLTLLGAISDTLSGRAGMDLGFDGLDWTSVSAIGSWYPLPDHPDIEVNWIFTATTELGRGNHIFYGRAQDQAGNSEEAYELARVVWLPTDSPDLSGSSLTASPTTVRPGEAVTFTLVARNGGFQEALVAVTDTLPAGLSLITQTLSTDVGYDPAAGVVAWPARLLWPGEFVRYIFQARAADGLGATVLVNRATAHAFWPNTDSLPAEQRQVFLDHEQTVVVSTSVAVNPDLAAGADVTPPWASLAVLTPDYQTAYGPDLPVGIVAAPDARWMYFREWTPDPTTGVWMVARSSDWISYSPTYTWTLSARQGIRYVGVWVADAALNVSTLDEDSLVLINRNDGSQVLADGQRVQYRGVLEQGTRIIAYLTTVSGDPDLYVWRPGNAFRPDRYSNDPVGPGEMETAGDEVVQSTGLYLLDVVAVGASEYRLTTVVPQSSGSGQATLAAIKEPPGHPLTVSNPLSAARVEAPLLSVQIYLPSIVRDH